MIIGLGDGLADLAAAAVQVGYGDISPTVWMSQLLFIVMMLLFLTVLPYQTGALLEALAHSSRYQRDRYHRKPRQVSSDASQHCAGCWLFLTREGAYGMLSAVLRACCT